MKILMIANYVDFEFEGGNSRFTYLLNMLNCKKNNIELITSNFRHGTKKHRIIPQEANDLDYKITLIEEPGYKKNVCLKRFYSHYILSKNLKRYLNNMIDKPDVIYCAVPSLDFAKEAAKYAEKNNIRFIIDVQDLWPEAFKMVFNIPIISNVLFYPLKKEADYVYKCADEIIAVSETYANRAALVNDKYKHKISAFLGTDLKIFDEYKEKYKVKFNDVIIRIAYVGTLGHSYNIKCIIDAIKLLNDKGINNIKFIVMGDGPLRNEFEEYAKSKNIVCEFTGRLEYPKMVGLLCSCDIAVNPIMHGAAQSIINKVGDYAMAGLPVINTLECIEYKELLSVYKAGYNCNNEDINQIANCLEELINNEAKRIKYGKNNRKLAEEKFDRSKTYNEIIKIIEE